MQVNPYPRPSSRWDQAWAARLVQRLDDMVQFLRGDFIPKGRLVSRGGRNRGITLVTDTTHTVAQFEEVIDVNNAAAVTVTLLETPDLGTAHRVYDGSGAAVTNNITIQRSGSGTINGGTSVTINANFGGFDVIFNGSQWIAHAI